MSQSRGCDGNQPSNRSVLLYSCSGAANVAEVADQAARRLMSEDLGSMFCLAGLGAEIESMIQTARAADVNVVIDGCNMDCARKIFAQCSITNVVFVRVTDLGIDKQPKPTRSTEQQVDQIVEHVKQVLVQM